MAVEVVMVVAVNDKGHQGRGTVMVGRREREMQRERHAAPTHPTRPGILHSTTPKRKWNHVTQMDFSGRNSSSTPGAFYTYLYNHAHRLRLEKLLQIELSRSSNGCFKALLDPGGGFRSETAVTKPFRK
jgi:hypothetical protein